MQTASVNGSASWVRDFLELTKMRLTTMVVFSAVLGYVIAADGAINIIPMLVLAVGGFCVAGAANAINQVLEKDYDSLMTRTMDRPIASGRMQPADGVLIAGFLLLIGEIMLGMFNPLTAFLGMLSFTLYAFLYTPMKRYGTLSVAIGAIPGALPVVIGCVAYGGEMTWTAVMLFAVQFLWQFPHFWAIGFLSFDQYRKAGFRLVPALPDGSVHTNLGMHTFIYACLLLPVCLLTYWIGVTVLWSTVAMIVITGWYALKAFRFWKTFDQQTARGLMFASFAYLPLMLLTILMGSMI